MALVRTALRLIIKWLPLLTLVAVCIVWWSPLGVVAALAAGGVVGSVLQRFPLMGAEAGGAALRSEPLHPLATEPPADDVLLNCGELGMGGPVCSTQMLRDGAIVDDIDVSGGQSCSAGWFDLEGTSLRIAQAWIHSCRVVVVYDEQHKVLGRLSALLPHEFHQALNERRHQHDDRAAADWVCSLPGERTQLQPYHGLWLAPDHPALVDPPQAELRHVLPDGRILLATLLLPDDLRLTVDPELFCRIRPYALQLDGVDSERHVCSLKQMMVSPGNQCLVVRGVLLGADMRLQGSVWLVHREGQWRAISTSAWARVGTSREPVWVDVLAVSDDGDVQCEAYTETWDGSTPNRQPTAHTCLELALEWRETMLIVRARNGRFTLRVPRR